MKQKVGEDFTDNCAGIRSDESWYEFQNYIHESECEFRIEFHEGPVDVSEIMIDLKPIHSCASFQTVSSVVNFGDFINPFQFEDRFQ